MMTVRHRIAFAGALIALGATPALAQDGGSLFPADARASGAYAGLSAGWRPARPGDIIHVVLTERTSASKSAGTDAARDGGIGLRPPVTGPLSFIQGSDLNFGGGQSFKGSGKAGQSNQLSGTIAVSVVAVHPNGTMDVAGEKRVRINDGDEFIRLSGRLRASDVGPDGRIASSLISDAQISYTGTGTVARSGRPGWLQRFLSRINPF